ncbi:MAG: NAD-dependent epimerase/dehydratase, partial [uncultured bacterium]
RAGNVIGGGDWSEDRIIPDLVRAVATGKQLEIRSPNSTRPWQHVLESLSGYLLLGQKLLEGQGRFADAWNFGPDAGSNRTVSEILCLMQKFWPDLAWYTNSANQPHEACLLHLDSSKARALLNWHPVWDINATIQLTAEWYRQYMEDGTLLSQIQIEKYQCELSRLGPSR